MDASEAMLTNAALRRCYERLTLGDISDWRPERSPALIFSNAALNWLPDHAGLMPRLARMLVRAGYWRCRCHGRAGRRRTVCCR